MQKATIGLRTKQKLVGIAAGNRLSRALLNEVYFRLPAIRKRHFHNRYCGIYRDKDVHITPGYWLVNFSAATIKMPLRTETAGVDWELALSPLGHELELKTTYEALLSSSFRPDILVDVGANFGTHSILFLCNGVEALSFEPNPACHAYFEDLCALNGVRGELHKAAVGSGEGVVKLRYPSGATWLGTIRDPGQGADLSESGLIEELVKLTALDTYLDRLKGRKVLIKIDAEGSELDILKGASAVLRECKPTVLFEAWSDASFRQNLFQFFVEHHYEIGKLPWDPAKPQPALGLADFQSSKADNFVANPKL